MIIHTASISASAADDDYGGMAHIHCVDRSGYCVGLSRRPGDSLIEVMVLDQMIHRTADVSAELGVDRLVIRLTKAVAAQLDGTMEYIVPLPGDAAETGDLNAALTAIFAVAGIYDRRP